MEAIKVSRWLRYGLVGFLLIAGGNHFVNPDFYLPLIPDYLPWHKALNLLSGILEILLGLALLKRETTYYGALGFIVLLVLFIPSHLYFIDLGSCIPGGLCTPPWVAWLRILAIHPLLGLWAWHLRYWG